MQATPCFEQVGQSVLRQKTFPAISSQSFFCEVGVLASLREENSMSLILSLQNSQGIVFCADSKATVLGKNGAMVEDPYRIPRKVFAHSHFLLGTFGCNIVHTPNNSVWIEHLISDVLSDDFGESPIDFMKRFQSFLIQDDRVYNFVFGTKSRDGFATVSYSLTNKSINKTQTTYSSGISWYGYAEMVPVGLDVSPSWSLPQLQENAKWLSETLIAIGDRFSLYNPIGGNVQITCMDPDGRVQTIC